MQCPPRTKHQPRKSLLRVWQSLATLAAIGCMAAAPARATVWTEFGDAGQTQAGAQITSADSSLALSSISGSLSSLTDVDLYMIRVANPTLFSATTVGGNLMDTQLFLFSLSGAAVYMNDDDLAFASDPASFLLSTLPAGNGYGPLDAGLYLLGISLNGNDPVNAVYDFLFAGGLSTDVRGPAVGLTPSVLADFTGLTNFDESGAYTITLTGAETAIPEPSSGALALLAGGVCAVLTSRRGRRIATAKHAA